MGSKPHPPYQADEEYWETTPVNGSNSRKANATFVLLARNSDLPGVMSSMKQMGEQLRLFLPVAYRSLTSTTEDRFNKKYNYPYVFLNEQPFTEEFKRLARPCFSTCPIEMLRGLPDSCRH